MRLLFFSLLLAASPKVNAQLGQYFEGHLFAKYSYGMIDSATYHNYSISGEYFVNPYIGLNYNLDLMFRSDGFRQFHTSAGALAGPPIILFGIFAASKNTNNNSEFNLGTLGIALGILILAAPDGVSFHIPLSYKWDLSPYANVLGLDYVRNKQTGYHAFKYAMSFGVKGTYLVVDRFTFSSFIETRKVAGMGWSFGGGFGLGVALGENGGDEGDRDFIEFP